MTTSTNDCANCGFSHRTGIPLAPITLAELTRPEWLGVAEYASATITVACPFCGGEHYHGASPWDVDHGTRRSHCGGGEYLITDPSHSVAALLPGHPR